MDKLPVRNDDIEMAVIGAILISPEMAKWVLTNMNPEWFYNEKNRIILRVLTDAIKKGTSADIVLACQWLTTAGVLGEIGGQKYLADCMEKISTPAHTQSYVMELKKLWQDRQIGAAIWAVNSDATLENIEKLRIKRQERDSESITGIINIGDCSEKILEIMKPRTKGLYDIFGMEELDKYHNGQEPGDILTIGARPGVGKTVIATRIAINFALKYREPVLYFSTEMRHEETIMRVLAPMSMIPGWKFRKRYYSNDGSDQAAIVAAAKVLVELPFFMVDKPSPTITDVWAAMAATKCKLVILDYIQRMDLEVGREGRPAAIGAVMTGFKNACRAFGSLGVVLSQLSRETDYLTGRARPQLADLKGSGDIEQESDVVILIWRHNKKDKDSKKDTVPNIPYVRPVEAIIVKNRHGSSDVSTQLIFDEKFIEFKEWTTEEAMKRAKDIIPSAPKEKKNAKSKSQWGAGNPDADADADGLPT
jgi:replicative DNA helicase